MIDRETALALICQQTGRLPAIDLPLADVRGHVLASHVIARLTQPPSAMSAMDGYAVQFASLSGGTGSLRLIGHAAAGVTFEGRVGTGEAVRVFTGSVIPEGADHVVIQEDVDAEGERITVREPQGAPGNIRPAGIDFSAGDTLIRAGTRLGPAELALAAAANHAVLNVRRKPRVALIANGDELVMPGGETGPANVICSTPFGLIPLIEAWGGEAALAGIAGDTEASIMDLAAACRDADVIVPLGGASVGDHDHSISAFKASGMDLVFSKVSVRPGKPTWFGTMGNTKVLGLPGNPASSLVCAFLFLKPLLAGMLGADAAPQIVSARTAGALGPNGPRETFLRGEMIVDETGAARVTAARNQDSSLLSPFLTSNVLIQRPAGAPVAEASEVVNCLVLK